MKELSIEEKAKRYDEAIEIANEINNEQRAQPFNVMTRVFPELKESEDERIRKELIKGISKTRPNTPFLDTNVTREEAIDWLEKQGEQKPTKKVKPKFHEGEWVVYDHRAYQVVELPKEGCINLGLRGNGKIEFAPSTYCRHWTIQDAKDGDILCTYECDEPKIVFILKGTPKRHYALSYHCYYNIMYLHFDSDSEKGCLAPNDEDVKPATKEQRDLLFQKMKEAGYEWDAEKKKLKKIEQKPSWSEEDEEIRTALIKYLGSSDALSVDLASAICWLKSLKDRVQLQQEWSEEDEKKCNTLIGYIVSKNELGLEYADWLKFLKGRYTWKPSDEQMNALSVAVKHGQTDDPNALKKLLEQLKKLRGNSYETTNKRTSNSI